MLSRRLRLKILIVPLRTLSTSESDHQDMAFEMIISISNRNHVFMLSFIFCKLASNLHMILGCFKGVAIR
jgi:hypothetical protein